MTALLRNAAALGDAFAAVGLPRDPPTPPGLADVVDRFGPATRARAQAVGYNPDVLRFLSAIYAYWSAVLLEWAADAEAHGMREVVAEAEAAMRQADPHDDDPRPPADR